MDPLAIHEYIERLLHGPAESKITRNGEVMKVVLGDGDIRLSTGRTNLGHELVLGHRPHQSASGQAPHVAAAVRLVFKTPESIDAVMATLDEMQAEMRGTAPMRGMDGKRLVVVTR